MSIATPAVATPQFVCSVLLKKSASKFTIAAKVSPADKQLTIPDDATVGVGLRGMRERIYQLGGNLNVKSNGDGTTIIATFPLQTPPPPRPLKTWP